MPDSPAWDTMKRGRTTYICGPGVGDEKGKPIGYYLKCIEWDVSDEGDAYRVPTSQEISRYQVATMVASNTKRSL